MIKVLELLLGVLMFGVIFPLILEVTDFLGGKLAEFSIRIGMGRKIEAKLIEKEN